MSNQYTIAGISGGLSQNSMSRKFLNEVSKALGEQASLTEITYGDIPIYNQDIEFPTPEAVARFRNELKQYDAMVIVMPEYNLSIPGGLKNLLDWLSRPVNAGDPKPILDYPVLVLSLSAGISGGMVPQESLRSVLAYLGANVMPQPRASFGGVYGMLDEHGQLQLNEASKGFLNASATAFIDYIAKFK